MSIKGMQPYLGTASCCERILQMNELWDATLSNPSVTIDDLVGFLGRDNVAFVLVRYSAYGCYAMRIERR